MISRTIKLPKTKSFFLLGPRQTGKSTLVKAEFSPETSRQYDLLKSEEFQRFVTQPSRLREEVLALDSKIRTVILDEIQKVPALLNEVHFLIENAPHPPSFVLTGSSARKLKRTNANLLGGRALTRRLYPLTHLELGERFNLQRTLEAGSLPGVILEPDPSIQNDILKSYVETYLKEEIQEEGLVRNVGPFLRFLSQAGFESGNILNYSNIARQTETTSTTVKEYFQILEDTLLGFFLFPFSKSCRNRVAGHPKFYLFDNGVQRALTKRLSVPLEEGTPDYGYAFEAWVIQEVVRLCDYHNKDFEFSYHRTEAGAEVDLVIETPRNKHLAIEIKSSANPVETDFRRGFKSLREGMGKKGGNSLECICACRAPYARKVESALILPWRELFKMLIEL